MKYLFLVYGDEKQFSAVPASVRDAFESACVANDELLRTSHYLIEAADLQGSATVTTVTAQNGEVSLSAGPYAQTPKQLVRLIFIQARDLNEAIRVASTMPQVQGGPIEVRLLVESA